MIRSSFGDLGCKACLGSKVSGQGFRFYRAVQVSFMYSPGYLGPGKPSFSK